MILVRLVWCSFCRMYFVFVGLLSVRLGYFSFSSLSRSVLSVIDVINFDISSSVLKSGKSHSFSTSIIFSR